MPAHFWGDRPPDDYRSAIRADISKQNYTVAPRFWYVDVSSKCCRCRQDFRFTAEEQRMWYEEYGFYVDSFPKHCQPCRHALRELKSLRQEYDRDIAAAFATRDIELKARLVAIVDRLCEARVNLPS